MSQVTVVLEAGWRSGSLNTAGHAAALGRALGAVPGPVTSAASAGCHRLIREFAATCVTTVDEMVELMPFAPVPTAAEAPSGRTVEQTRILDAVSGKSPRSVDDIARRAGLSVAQVQTVLGPLELDGAVTERDRGWVRATR